jgi:hypothetical protein
MPTDKNSDRSHVTASGPVDGMGEPHPEGSYIQLSLKYENGNRHQFHISRGAAEVLMAEIAGALA